MKIIADPNWASDIQRPVLNSVSYNNKRIVAGSSDTLVNPALEDRDDDEMIQYIEDILSRHHLTFKLREIEDANRERIGPRSHAKTWLERKADLYSYFKHEDYDPEGFGTRTGGQLRPVSIQKVADSLIRSSSAGLPYMVRKGIVLEDALRNYAEQREKFPCVLFTRTQEQMKTRSVWGYPISDTLWEQSFFIPWLRRERELPWRASLFGPEAVDRAMTMLLASKRQGEVVYCVDFSAYDASINPELAFQAFSYIASHFQVPYRVELYRLFRRFVTIPIYTPDGEISGPHGVPSGSSFTNSVDSLVQLFVSDHSRFDRCQIQGDDGVYILDKSESDSFPERFKTRGLDLNESKSAVFDTTEALFLQRYYHPDYSNRGGGGLGGVYSLFRAYNRIKYLEKWTDFDKEGISGADFFSLRTIMILENCKHHPGFEQFVQAVKNWDRKGLTYTQSGLKAFSRSLQSKAKAGLFGAEQSFKRGIHSFETVKLLNK